MGSKSSKIVNQKLNELQGQDTCGGDLHQHIIITTEDKVRLVLNGFIDTVKYAGSWPAQLSAAISLFVTWLSFSQFKSDFTFWGFSVPELRIFVFVLAVVYSVLGLKSAFCSMTNRFKSPVENLLRALDPSRTKCVSMEDGVGVVPSEVQDSSGQ